MQGSLFPPPSDWHPLKVSDLPELDGNFAFDCETRDPLLKTYGAGWAFDMSSEMRGEMVGFSVAVDGFKTYVPLRHAGGDNVEYEPALRWLKAQFARKGDKVFYSWLYDVGWLRTEGIFPAWDEIHDGQYLAALIDENQYKYDLDTQGMRYVGKGKNEKMLRETAKSFGLRDQKGEMWKLPGRYVGPYGEDDADTTWDLYKELRRLSRKDGLERCYEMERSLMPIIMEMRLRGVRVDLERAEVVRQKFREKEAEFLALIQRETGCRVRPGVPSKDAAAVLRKMGVSVPQNLKTGNDSVVAAWLERQNHPVATAIVRARKFNKAARDFIDGMVCETQVNGRIHASFHPLKSEEGGTVTGRFSCTNPNLQQVPARDPEIGPDVRSCFVPEEGEKWGAPDYSSQEPRWVLHFAHAINAPGAANAVRIFRENPKTDFHGMMTDIIWPELDKSDYKKFRRKAKDIFLGKCYGMGGAKLCRQLGLPTAMWTPPNSDKPVEVAGEAGREIINRFDQMAPFVKKLSEAAKTRAETVGYVLTHDGRRCHCEGGGHKALNRIVQGSSAGQIKKSMVAVYKELGKIPLLQVHDELGYSVADQAENRRICDIMETCIPGLNVPFVVEAITANNWGECKEM